MGIPALTVTMIGFPEMARRVATDAGYPDMRIMTYPGTIALDSLETLNKHFKDGAFAEAVDLLTKPVNKSGTQRAKEPGNTDVVFSGSMEEVNKYFYERQWTDGLPIIPPTLEKVQAFMKFTDRSPDEVIGVLPPRQGAATVWKVAVNGVMAGCRPEYMPILLAIVEVMAEPQYTLHDSGSTPGWEAMIMLNGPIRDQLGFNYREAVMRPGFQPNISIGRFYRLFLRNVPGFLPRTSDQATFGHNFRVVVPENDDFVHAIGWKTLAERRGFKADENVVTIVSVRAFSEPFAAVGDKPEQILDYAAEWGSRMNEGWQLSEGNVESHVWVMSPAIAKMLASGGYSDTEAIEYMKRNIVAPAKEVEKNASRYYFWEPYNLCEKVKEGFFPKVYCESDDPNRLVPLIWPGKSDLLLLVTGDEKRNRQVFIRNNAKQGYATSRPVKMPPNWDTLLQESLSTYD